MLKNIFFKCLITFIYSIIVFFVPQSAKSLTVCDLVKKMVVSGYTNQFNEFKGTKTNHDTWNAISLDNRLRLCEIFEEKKGDIIWGSYMCSSDLYDTSDHPASSYRKILKNLKSCLNSDWEVSKENKLIKRETENAIHEVTISVFRNFKHNGVPTISVSYRKMLHKKLKSITYTYFFNIDVEYK